MYTIDFIRSFQIKDTSKVNQFLIIRLSYHREWGILVSSGHVSAEFCNNSKICLYHYSSYMYSKRYVECYVADKNKKRLFLSSRL